MFNDSILHNSFNRKKTKQKDINRLCNISLKNNQMVDLNISTKKQNIQPTQTQPTLLDDIKIQPIHTTDTISFNTTTTTTTHTYQHNIPKTILKNTMISNYNKTDIFDITNFNKNINHLINIHIPPIPTIDFNTDHSNINTLYNKNITTIHNVYQTNYAQNIKPTGFGDFIRGCYFLLQFCDKYNFKPNIIINHPIALFLNKFSLNFTINNTFIENVPMFIENNWKETKLDSNNFIVNIIHDSQSIHTFISYLSTLIVNNKSLFMYNIMFPYNPIEKHHTKYMRDLFQPNTEMNTYINNTLNTLFLEKNTYSIIHIRSGDSFLKETTKTFNISYLTHIFTEINILINSNLNSTFLLIADNNEIKYFILKYFSNIKFIFNKITHLGEGVLLERDKIKNTLLDFYLLSYSNYIYSYTSYIHGSGFSYWCAVTYNIPYKCKYISNK